MAQDEDKHFVGKVAHKAAIEKDGKVLLAKGDGDEFWDIPGGRINSGEKPAQALKREIKEELGVDIEVGKPFFADLIISTKTKEERYFICFYAKVADGQEPCSVDPEESAELYWVSSDEVETIKIYEVCREALRAFFSENK